MASDEARAHGRRRVEAEPADRGRRGPDRARLPRARGAWSATCSREELTCLIRNSTAAGCAFSRSPSACTTCSSTRCCPSTRPATAFAQPRPRHTIAERIVRRAPTGAPVILLMGAHVIKMGLSRFVIDLMERGLVTHVGMNGAGPIHDYELALIGATTESVARYISEGQFGLWHETGRINDIVAARRARGPGLRRGARPRDRRRGLPAQDVSILAAGYRLRVPVTVHVGIGYDIIHEHPNCDGAALGAASYRDFLVFTQSGHQPRGRRLPELRHRGHGAGGLPEGAGDGAQRGAPGRPEDHPLHDRRVRPAGPGRRPAPRGAEDRRALLLPPVQDDPGPHRAGRRRELLHPRAHRGTLPALHRRSMLRGAAGDGAGDFMDTRTSRHNPGASARRRSWSSATSSSTST